MHAPNNNRGRIDLPEVTTAIARLTRLRADLVEVHYFPGCTLSTIALAEVARARRELMGAHPYAMLSVLPPDVDFELNAMNVDHLREDREEGLLLAIAVVVSANMIEMVRKLYFSYYPWLRRILVTDKMDEARGWIEDQSRNSDGTRA